jgi:hypothetical protein
VLVCSLLKLKGVFYVIIDTMHSYKVPCVTKWKGVFFVRSFNVQYIFVLGNELLISIDSLLSSKVF